MFEVLKTEGKARRGVFTCAHGTVQTPVFMNVGTQGSTRVKSGAGITGRPLAAGLSSGPAGTLPSGVGAGVPLV